jgi:hypothetical protein
MISLLEPQVVEKTNVVQQWHFFVYNNFIKATIYKYNDKSLYEWSIMDVRYGGYKELIKEGLGITILIL